MSTLDELVAHLLEIKTETNLCQSMSEWFAGYKQWAYEYTLEIDRSIVGGYNSHCLGFAFASGYQSAIAHLFGEEETKLASLSVTESTGNHPRAIATELMEEKGELRVSGKKTFISGARDAELMFVACLDKRNGDGMDAQGRPQIKVLRLPTNRLGIVIKEMPDLGFLPEISHGSVSLDNVVVSETDVLEGDGYQNYVKPFRTYEDLHVLTAVTAYRLAEAVKGGWPFSVKEAHLTLLLSLRGLADMDLFKPQAHIILSGCRTQLHSLIKETDPLFEETSVAAYELWKRDRKLLGVAKKAHEKRTESAWSSFSSR